MKEDIYKDEGSPIYAEREGRIVSLRKEKRNAWIRLILSLLGIVVFGYLLLT